MRRSLFVSFLIVVCGYWAVPPAHASRDVNGTIWDFEGRFDVFSGEVATFDGDGTQLN